MNVEGQTEIQFREEMAGMIRRDSAGSLVPDKELREALGNVPGWGWGHTAYYLILETAENVIDNGLNGDPEGAFEFKNFIEHMDDEDHATSIEAHEGVELAGQMYDHSWHSQSESNRLEALVDQWAFEIVPSVTSALISLAEIVEERVKAEAEEAEVDRLNRE